MKKYYLIFLGVGLAILSWIVEAAMHYFLFLETLVQAVIFPGFHEGWMRGLIALLFIVFGVYTQFIVNQRRESEENLELAYAELNQIFDTAADGMRVVDKNFNVIKINETLSVMSGINKAEAMGKKCFETFRGEACETDICPLVRILRGEERVEYEGEKERVDGKKIHCIVTATPFRDLDGNLIGIVEDYRDITDRNQAEIALKKSEEELRSSESKLKALIEYSPDAIIMKNIKGKYVFLNKVALDLIGAKKDEDLFPQISKGISISDEEIIRTKNSIVTQETVKLGKNEVDFEISKYPVLDSKGEVSYICIVCRDISENKKIERIKDNLIRDVSHELKTPIAIAQMAYEMSERGIKAKNVEQVHKAQIIAMESIRRLRQDVDNILDLFALREGGKLTDVREISLGEVTKEIKEELNYLLDRKEIKFSINIASEADKIFAIEKDIKTLLFNIIDNAVKFTDKGSISVFAKAVGSKVLLRVKDTGCGIARQGRTKLFDAFYQRHAAVSGTGVGLAICREIVRRYKGKIRVVSAGVGQGTVVLVSLPFKRSARYEE
ncbi:MAG: PAS domain S-box protein [Candidatus Omnitrophota bacterium]|nr:MAG: PAS domain S-box protein [Candidatus Omnitrophota bacterium]